ncbi:MAG: malto-oligosyltrehalose trehalohydrolase [Euzebya sp.]
MPSSIAPEQPPHKHGHGVHMLDSTIACFDVWAPQADRVDITVGTRHLPLQPTDNGWWRLVTDASHGTRYAFHLDDGDPLPDPAARWLPDGVHASAAVLDPRRWSWTTPRFQPAPLTGAVIYELHVGTFTTEGIFEAAADHLHDLAELGITHVEIMPVNAFDGVHGWGYDGVAWWAVHQPYGGPDGLAAFVDTCHANGLGVILDVVHNHLGPSGNYLPRFGPYLQTDAESTWGKVINLDGPDSGPVRQFIISSALAWLRDYHIDALRLDAVHALDDRGSATHLLAELADAVTDLSEQTGRRLELIAETDRNDPQTIVPRAQGGLGLDAQWADDLHHAIHVAVTGETDGYYIDYSDPLAALARAYMHGFVYDGRHSAYRERVVGAPVPSQLSLRRLIACTQNHDQVGNRAAGDRLTSLVAADLVRAATLLLCTAPHTPMLFMGQEYGETRPFAFFSDMPDEALRHAIREGRRREFQSFESWQDESGRNTVPDPLDPQTFRDSKLDRTAAATDQGLSRRALWRDLLALRRSQPALGTGRQDLIQAQTVGPQLLRVTRRASPGTADRPTLQIWANLGDQPASSCPHPVLLSTADPAYGGPGHPDPQVLPARSAAIHRIPAPSNSPRHTPGLS